MVKPVLLLSLAIASFVFCIVFTYYTAKHTETHQGQSVKESMHEAWTNIAIGFSINYVANFFILPLAVTGLDPVNNFLIGWLYTTLSFIRQFIIRRVYNKKARKVSKTDTVRGTVYRGKGK